MTATLSGEGRYATSDVASSLAVLERIVLQGGPAEIAEIVGHLERLKYLAWSRQREDTASPPSDTHDPDRYLTIAEVAERLGLSRSYCYELARRGILAVTALGTAGARARAFRIKLSDLATWEMRLKQQTVDARLGGVPTSRGGGTRVSAVS